MTYLAPRQGLFAIIIFISFCLHCILLVFTTEHQVAHNRQQKSERLASLLVDEAHMLISSEDRVGLSVLAGRYASEQDVTALTIKNNNDEVLVQMGEAPLQQGIQVAKQAIDQEKIVGEVLLTVKPTSKREMLILFWPFIIGTFFLHFFVWLIYGYVARPTKQQIKQLSTHIHDHYFALYKDGKQNTVNLTSNQSKVDMLNDTADSQAEPEKPRSMVDILRSSRAQATKAGIGPLTQQNNTANVHIVFNDSYNLLKKLDKDVADNYFVLCTDMLQTATTEILKLPLLQSVRLMQVTPFNSDGAIVALISDANDEKLELASVMLAVLYQMLNHFVYEKHRELKRFALHVSVGMSYQEQSTVMDGLLLNHANQHEIFMMFNNLTPKFIDKYLTVTNFDNPTSIYERECVYINDIEAGIKQRIETVKNNILITTHQYDE